MQRQVLEGFDVRSLPTALLRPVDGQHVVGELLPENQAGHVGLWLARGAAFDDDIRCLRWSRAGETGREEEADRKRAEQATDTRDGFYRCYWQSVLISELKLKKMREQNCRLESSPIKLN